VDTDGRRRYLDCEWELPDGRVVVLEIDGSFHLKVGNWWRDMKRERAVVLSRSTVLRCASIELRLEPWEVIADLRRAGVPSAPLFT
jgi:very-short-patch-repair endonuclease